VCLFVFVFMYMYVCVEGVLKAFGGEQGIPNMILFVCICLYLCLCTCMYVLKGC